MAGKYVIIDSDSADQLSVPMTLAQANYIADRERDIAEDNGGQPCRLAVVGAGAELRKAQDNARRHMAGNPPKTRILWDGPVYDAPGA
jgi:hypothetical protein